MRPSFARLILGVLVLVVGSAVLPQTGPVVEATGAAAATITAGGQSGWQVVVPQRPQPLFHSVTGIAVDRQDNVYVSDYVEGRVKKISPRGKLLASWGSDAPDSPLHVYPRDLAVSGQGSVYLLGGPATLENLPTQPDTVTKLSPSGRFQTHWSIPAADAIAVGGSGNVFVLSTEQLASEQKVDARIDKFSPTGSLLATWHTPSFPFGGGWVVQANGLTVDPRGNVSVTVAAVNNGPKAGPLVTAALYTFSPTGALLTAIPGSRVPLGPVQAADGAGNVYMAPDQYAGANGIEKLSPSGKLLARWPALGGRQLGADVRLTLDRQGRIYVADTANIGYAGGWAQSGVIDIVTAGGRLLARWGQVQPIVNFPLGLGIAVDARGTVYATAWNQNVFLSIPPGSHVARFLGQRQSNLSTPAAIALGPGGNVYMNGPDVTAGEIDVYSPGGQLLRQWRLSRSPGPFVQGLAVDRAGNMYTDKGPQIIKLAPSGKVVARFGAAGAGPAEFQNPEGLAVDAAGNIYVADTWNNRVQKLSPSGQPLVMYGSPGQLDRPHAVAVGPDGHVYVVDTTHPTIFEFAPDGPLLHTYGVAGVLPGQLAQPTGVAVGRDGTVYVLDWGNSRIQTFVR